MSLCKRYNRAGGIKTPSTSSSRGTGKYNVGNISSTISGDSPFIIQIKVTDGTHKQAWRPRNPDKFKLPSILINPDIESFGIDFDSGRIYWLISYENITEETNESLREQGVEIEDCPPLVTNKNFLLGVNFPFIREQRTTALVSILCKKDRNSFLDFLYKGAEDIVGVPSGITGEYAESFFFRYFIEDSGSDVEYDDERCIVGIDICNEGVIRRNDGRSAFGSSMIVTGVNIDEDNISYNLIVNGYPAGIKGPRYDDKIGLDKDAPAFNFPIYPEGLQRSMDALADAANDVMDSEVDSELGSYPSAEADFNSEEEELNDNNAICGDEKGGVDYSRVLSLLSFNYSYFAAAFVDALFMRLYAIMDLIFWVFWNIFPLCNQEWSIVEDKIKRIFSFDVFEGDGKCYPLPIKIAYAAASSALISVTCCGGRSLKDILAKVATGKILSLMNELRACVFYMVICVMRLIRNLMLSLIIVAYAFIMFVVTCGAQIICKMISTGRLDNLQCETDDEQISKVLDKLRGGGKYNS